METLTNSVRIPFSGRVMRDGPHLVPHDMAFPSAMMSLKVLMGGQHRTHALSAHGRSWRSDADYYQHLGLSGEGFRFLFDTAEYFRFQEEEGAQPLLDCFAAEGIPVKAYAARPVQGIEGTWRDEAQLMDLVLGTLKSGYPALLLGRTGSDWTVLATGFENGGETLVGWTFVPGADMSNKSFSPEDCQYIMDWSKGVDAAALITGAPGEVKDREVLFRRGLKRGQRFLTQSASHPHGEKTNFYDNWIRTLEDDSFFKAPFTGRPRIDPDIWDLAERRAFAAEFLEEAGQVLHTDVMAPASKALHQIHDLMWKINSLCEGEDAHAKLRDPAVRREIVSILNACRDLDRKAADVIEQASGEGNF